MTTVGLPGYAGTVLFDLDGTLLDSSRPVLEAYAVAFAGMGLAVLPEAELHSADLAARHRELRRVLPRLNVLGGCCGTDHRHVEAIGRAWLS